MLNYKLQKNIYYFLLQVLPLQIAMKKPKNFSKVFGVLNVGTFITTLIYIGCGFIGYLKYGEDTKASLTLNLPGNQM